MRTRLAIAWVFVAACRSQPLADDARTYLIEPDGTLVHWDEWSLYFPPGAVSEPLTLSLSRAEAPEEYEASTSAYRCDPFDHAFDVPIEVRVDEQPLDSVVWWDQDDGWVALATDVDGSSLLSLFERCREGFVAPPAVHHDTGPSFGR